MNAQNPRAFLDATPLNPVAGLNEDATLATYATEWLTLNNRINNDKHDAAETDALGDRQTEIEQCFCDTPAAGNAGLRAKAQLLSRMYGEASEDLDDRESLTVALVNDVLRLTAPDPVVAAIDRCWAAYGLYEAEVRDDPARDDPEQCGQSEDIKEALQTFGAARRAVLAIRPTSPEGMAAYARWALRLSDEMGSDDPNEEALAAFTRTAIGDLIAQARVAEDVFVAASAVVHNGGRTKPTAEEEEALRVAADRDEELCRVILATKPATPDDVEQMVGFLKHRHAGTSIEPSEGLFDFLDNVSSYLRAAA